MGRIRCGISYPPVGGRGHSSPHRRMSRAASSMETSARNCKAKRGHPVTTSAHLKLDLPARAPSHAPQHTPAAHIIAVDDNAPGRNLIAEYLGQNDLRVTAAPDWRAVQPVLETEKVDLVLLNPKKRVGDAIALTLASLEPSAIPLIIVTDRREEADRVMGMELGAGAYLTMPFSPRELLARIRAVLRRSRSQLLHKTPKPRAYRFDGWELNVNTRRLTASDGRKVRL